MAFELFGSAPSFPAIQGAPQPSTNLSQVLQLIGLVSTLNNRAQMQSLNNLRMAMYQQQLENGRSEQDKKRILTDRYLHDYAMRVATNPEAKAEYRNIMDMSPARREEAFQKFNDKYIEPYKYYYPNDYVKPRDVYNYLLHEPITKSKIEAKQIDDDYWNGVWQGIKSDAAHLWGGIKNAATLGQNAQQYAKEVNDAKQEALKNSIYLQDKQRRERHGETFTKQPLSMELQSIISSLPTLGAYFGAAAAGPAAPAITGGLSAALGDIDYAGAVEGTPGAMSAPERFGNIAANAAFGALAPGVARPFRAVRTRLSPAYKPLAPAQSRGAAIARGAADSAAGMAALGAGQQAANNYFVGSVTGQDIPLTQGVVDAAAQGAILGLPMGAFFGRNNFVAPKQEVQITPKAQGGSEKTNQIQPEPRTPTGGNGVEQTPLTSVLQNSLLNVAPDIQAKRGETVMRDMVQYQDPAVLQIHDLILKGATSEDLKTRAMNEIWANDSTNIKPEEQGFAAALEKFVPQANSALDRMLTSAANAKTAGVVSGKIKSTMSAYTKRHSTFQNLRQWKEDIAYALSKNDNITPEKKLELARAIDKVYDDVIRTREWEAEDSISTFVNRSGKVEEVFSGTGSQGASQNSNAGNPSDLDVTASTTGNASKSTGTDAEKTGGNSDATQSGVINGAETQNDGTPQENNGTTTAEKADTSGATEGRAGATVTGDQTPNAGAGEPNAETRKQPDGAEPKSPSGGSNSARLDRVIQATKSGTDLKLIADETVRVAGDPKAGSTIIYTEDAKAFYNEAKEAFDDNAGILKVADKNAKLFDELTPEEKSEQVQKFLQTKIDARNIDQTKPEQPVCP